MMKKKRTVHALLAAGTLCVLASTSALAVDPAPKCQSSKLITSGKYAACRLNAESKAVRAGAQADYSVCNLGKFATVEAAVGMGVCPTEGDQTTVKDYLDDCTSRAAAWLAGDGGLPVPPGKVAKTGQTTCYDSAGVIIACAGTGQDGETQNGLARSFTDNGDGTITDNNSGLMWEKLSDDGSIHDKDGLYTWADAFASKVATLNMTSFAGHNDWRLPSITELETLKNFGALAPAVYWEFNAGCIPGCTVATCSCTQPLSYFSSTTHLNFPQTVWLVFFEDGFTHSDYKIDQFFVRAVRFGS